MADLQRLNPDDLLRDAGARVVGTLLLDPRFAAARLHPPTQAGVETTAGVGRSDVLLTVLGEMTSGRRVTVGVLPADADAGVTGDVPSWTFPGSFGDALAAADPRRWIALTFGGADLWGMFVTREFAVRRLVMARHIDALRHGINIAISDDTVTLDYALDLAVHKGVFVTVEQAMDEVERDSARYGEPGHGL